MNFISFLTVFLVDLYVCFVWLSAEILSVNGLPQCVCLVDESGNRTMRPCLSSAVKIQADELTREDFKGSKVSHLVLDSVNLLIVFGFGDIF